MYLDPKGKDASLLDKKIKEHIAESQSRKQKEGRKKSNTGGSWKQRRFVELHEQIERLVAELPPAKERTEEQKQQLKKIAQKKWKIKNKLDGKVDHLIPRKAAMSSTERSQKCREGKTESEKEHEREATAEGMRRIRKKQKQSS